MTSELVVLPANWAAMIASEGGIWGTLDFRRSDRERAVVVNGFTKQGAVSARRDTKLWHPDLHLQALADHPATGLWYRVDEELHELHTGLIYRAGALALDYLRNAVVGGWRDTEGSSGTIVLTLATNATADQRWRAWKIVGTQAQPLVLDLFDAGSDLLSPIEGHWPMRDLAQSQVVVVGVGSIGGAACDSLLSYGLRKLVLVDPDSLVSHNFARHVLGRDQVGRLKVRAMTDRLRTRDSQAEVTPLSLDVIYDADQLRPLLRESAGVLVAADSVAPRRVANHLACWAGIPAVFSCVLANGSLGELVRYRPRATACLLCLRKDLEEQDVLEVEASLDLPYGTGTRHLPMTAVGSDLWLMGTLAAKLLVATLLERKGHPDQLAEGDHAVVGLRPRPDTPPPPFDVTRAGEIKWLPAAAPRGDCPSCQVTTTA